MSSQPRTDVDSDGHQKLPFRQIRACQTEDTIVVYQAYNVEIAEAAVAQQRLDASDSFKVGRMTWVKPSFYWCMYRSGWSYKDRNQARILQIRMTKSGFLTLLGQATPSGGLVRYQWDPERNVRTEKLPYRSLQLGISGDLVSQWINEWTVDITDITDDVRRWKSYIDEGKEGVRRAKREIAEKLHETVFDIGEELELQLGMRDPPAEDDT